MHLIKNKNTRTECEKLSSHVASSERNLCSQISIVLLLIWHILSTILLFIKKKKILYIYPFKIGVHTSISVKRVGANHIHSRKHEKSTEYGVHTHTIEEKVPTKGVVTRGNVDFPDASPNTLNSCP